MSKTLLLLVFVMVAAACGTGGDVAGDTDPAPSAPASTGAATTTGGSATPATQPPATETTGGSTSSSTALPPIDGPVAPDFSLELSDGSTFVLSEQARPVYLVFWAEW